MKIIGKMTGLRLLEEIANNNLSCGTMVRYKRDDLILTSNPPQPVYEYYKYTVGDKRFHRCDENGKLGATGQQRFMNYSTLNKTFEIVEMDKEFEIYKMGKTAIYQSADSISIRPIIEEEQDIKEISNDHEFYCYSQYETYKNEIDKVLYILKAINSVNDRLSITNNKINELIKAVNELKKNER